MLHSIHYYPQAEAALNSLDAEERNRMFGRISKLAESGLSDPDVSRLNGVPDIDQMYVLRASNGLRVVFTASRDSITVMDVLNGYFAERYG